jgi:hypothetical protein
MKSIINLLNKLVRFMTFGLLAANIATPEEKQVVKRHARPMFPTPEQSLYLDIQRKMKRGLKFHNINGVHVLALNEKNAERKFRNAQEAGEDVSSPYRTESLQSSDCEL